MCSSTSFFALVFSRHCSRAAPKRSPCSKFLEMAIQKRVETSGPQCIIMEMHFFMTGRLAMKRLNNLKVSVILVWALSATAMCWAVFAGTQARASDVDLILESESDPMVIGLEGSFFIRRDGTMEAHTTDSEVCTPGCAGVDVGNPDLKVNGTATAITVQEGQQLLFTWHSRGAWTCAAGGNLPGWTASNLHPRSELAVSSNNLAAGSPYQATILCSNGPVSESGLISITVN
jgi:hypothetical protein